MQETKLVFTHPCGEGSYGLVYSNGFGGYDVYEIPLFGGSEMYVDTFVDFTKAVECAKSLT